MHNWSTCLSSTGTTKPSCACAFGQVKNIAELHEQRGFELLSVNCEGLLSVGTTSKNETQNESLGLDRPAGPFLDFCFILENVNNLKCLFIQRQLLPIWSTRADFRPELRHEDLPSLLFSTVKQQTTHIFVRLSKAAQQKLFPEVRLWVRHTYLGLFEVLYLAAELIYFVLLTASLFVDPEMVRTILSYTAEELLFLLGVTLTHQWGQGSKALPCMTSLF